MELWGRDRRSIARSGSLEQTTGELASDGGIDIIFGREKGDASIRDQHTHAQMLISFTSVPGTPWILVSGMRYAHVLYPIYRTAAFFALTALCLPGIMIGRSVAIMRRIARDLNVITRAVSEIGNGHLDTHVSLDSQSELTSMGEAATRWPSACKSASA